MSADTPNSRAGSSVSNIEVMSYTYDHSLSDRQSRDATTVVPDTQYQHAMNIVSGVANAGEAPMPLDTSAMPTGSPGDAMSLLTALARIAMQLVKQVSGSSMAIDQVVIPSIHRTEAGLIGMMAALGERLTQRIDDMAGEAQDSRGFIDNLGAKIDNLMMDSQRSHDTIKTLEEQNKTLYAKIDDLTMETQSSRDTIKTVEEQNKALYAKIDGLAMEAQISRDSIKALEGQNESLHAKIDGLAMEAQTSRDTITRLEDTLCNMTAQNQNLRVTADGLAAEVRENKATAWRLEERLSRMETTLGSVLDGAASSSEMICNRVDGMEEKVVRLQDASCLSQAADARARLESGEKLDRLGDMLSQAEIAGKRHSQTSTQTQGMLERLGSHLGERAVRDAATAQGVEELRDQLQQVRASVAEGLAAALKANEDTEDILSRKIDRLEVTMYKLDPWENMRWKMDRVEFRLTQMEQSLLTEDVFERSLLQNKSETVKRVRRLLIEQLIANGGILPNWGE